METKKYQDISLKLTPLLNVLSHPARLQIILYLAKFTVSEHLSKLREVGLLKSLADVNCMYYTIDDEKFEYVKKILNDYFIAIDHSQGNRKVCFKDSKKEIVKCNRVYERCKTLPCLKINKGYPDI